MAREIVAREFAGSVEPEMLDHITLLTSELVSERVGAALRHTKGRYRDRAGTLTLELQARPGQVSASRSAALQYGP
jgi:hypothetical protein